MTVDKAALTTLARGIAAGEYSLLLGAGATAGAIGGDGSPLPTGPGFKDEVIHRFDLGSSAVEAPLQRVFGAAAKRDPQALSRLVIDRFTHTTPSWQSKLTELPWHRVWTLNIDDILETAFAERIIPFASLTFQSTSARRQEREALEIVHLHGAANELKERLRVMDPSDALDAIIFDWPQYAQAVRREPPWHQRFVDEFIDTPFLIVGAKIVDEIDFWRVFSQPSTAQELWGHPTISVLREVNDFDRDQLQNDLNVIVEISDAETFIDNLLHEYHRVLRDDSDVRPTDPTADELRFLTQFINLRQYEPRRITTSSDFYDGWEPDWSTITNNADAQIDFTDYVAQQIIDSASSESSQQKIFFIHGAPGTGKSTALLRIGERSRRAGLTPWLFRGDEMLAPDSLVEWARNHPHSVYLFDDCADFSGPIGDAVEQAAQMGTRLVVAATARENRREYASSRLPSDLTVSVFPSQIGELTTNDIERLIDKLESVGRLGRITRLNTDRRRQYFRLEHSGQLFSSMAGLETGEGFIDRIVRTHRDLDDDQIRVLVSAVALAYNYGNPLRISIASQVSGFDPSLISRLLRRELAGIVVGERTGLRLPHKMHASLLVQHAMTSSERFDVGIAVAKAIGKHLDRASIAQMSREHRLSRQILHHGNVMWLVGESRGRDFYEAVAPEYSWNGRFWDQRALFEMRLGDLGRARSYAERSVHEHPHPYAFTTLGRVLMGVAERSGELEEVREAINALNEARGIFRKWRYWQPDEYPYTTFFAGLLAFVNAHGFGALDSSARQEWSRWMYQARRSGIAGIYDALHDWEEEWSRISEPSDE